MWLSLCTALLLVWPFPEPRVERGFEPPPQPWAAGHRGVDLVGEAGQEVVATGPGVVSFAGSVAGKGVVSVLLDDSGDPPLRTTYEPVRPEVGAGERVSAGQVVGTLRARPTHCGERPCLHWGLRRGERYLDPLSLLRPERPVLLPVPQSADGAPPPPSPRGAPAAQEGDSDSAATTALTAGGYRITGSETVALSLLAATLLVAGAGWARRRLTGADRPRAPRGDLGKLAVSRR